MGIKASEHLDCWDMKPERRRFVLFVFMVTHEPNMPKTLDYFGKLENKCFGIWYLYFWIDEIKIYRTMLVSWNSSDMIWRVSKLKGAFAISVANAVLAATSP